MDENMLKDLSPDISRLVEKLMTPLTESFFIKGEPDYRLGICLKRCPETLQELIAEEYGMELGRGKKRKSQLELLEQKIIEEVPSRIEIMTVDDFKLLIKLAAGEEDVAEAASGFSLQKRGWVFYYVDGADQNAIPVFPGEILMAIKKLMKNQEFIMRMAYFETCRSYVRAFLKLYGVFEKSWLFAVMEKHSAPVTGAPVTGAPAAGAPVTGAADVLEGHADSANDGLETVSGEKKISMADPVHTEMLINRMKEFVGRLQKETENFGMEEEYIFDPDLEEDEDYKKRFDAVKEKEYYEPTPTDIEYYRDKSFDDRSREYRLLKRYFGKKLDDSTKVYQLLEELTVEAVEELGGVFAVTEIMERYECSFSSAEDLKEFERLFRNWEDQLRKWNNRGFTNEEMRARGESGSPVKIDWDLAAMKFKGNTPDPDAPCPCGSGKKYRQCCGRVKK